MKYMLKARSSEGGYYDVAVSAKDEELILTCTCMAAQMGTMCKHRVALLTGTPTGIYTPSKKGNELVAEAISYIETFDISLRYGELKSQLDELTAEFEEIKRRFKAKEKTIKNQINALFE